MIKLLFLILIFFTQLTEAGLLRPSFQGVRPSGMGDAFGAIADDANALFYNPAGLVNIKGVHFHLFDITLGVDSMDTLTRINNALFKGDTEHLIRTDKEFLRFSVRPTFVAPNFAFSVFNDVQGYFDIKDVLAEGIDVYAHHDLGAALGFAIPIAQTLSIGATVKAFQRTGTDFAQSPEDILNDIPLLTAIVNGETYSIIKDRMNTGWAASFMLGALVHLPHHGKDAPKIQFSAVVEDLGNTSFHKLGGVSAPKTILQSFNFGASLTQVLSANFTWNNSVEYKHAFEGIPLVKKIHAGTELRHKYFGIRAGMSQGYATGGLSIEFPPHTRLHLATFSNELGDNFGESEHRWYLMQLVIGFNPL